MNSTSLLLNLYKPLHSTDGNKQKVAKPKQQQPFAK